MDSPLQALQVSVGLATKDGKVQVDTLLYDMGSDADDVMLSFRITEDEACEGQVRSLLCQVIYERAKFNTRCQWRDESVDAFTTALHNLAQHCDYKYLNDEMIRDRLVAGLRDAKLKRLQLDAELTLETALTKARMFTSNKHSSVARKKKLMWLLSATECADLGKMPQMCKDTITRTSALPG